MDRVHFDDLTKIDVQLGRLDDDTYTRLRAHDGPIEVRALLDWLPARNPQWDLRSIYRAKPQPLTKPQVPWEHMSDWVQYVARDENGALWAYDLRPDLDEIGFRISIAGLMFEPLCAFKIAPGTCDWRDSLVKRPEGL